MKTLQIILMSGLLAFPCRVHAQHFERPHASRGPTDVSIHMFLIDVDSIDTAEQNFAANLFLHAEWEDPRLAHEETGLINHPLDQIWTPGLKIVNQQRAWQISEPVALANPGGTVHYRQHIWGYFSQPLNVKDFPFDAHTFSLLVATSGYGSNEVRLIADPTRQSGMADALSVADFDVTDTRTGPFIYQPAPMAPPISGYRLDFSARRDSGYFMRKVLIPLLLVVAMSWIVFWIDPKEGGTQIGLGATSMLTLIAYRFAIAESLPKVAYLTRLDNFLLGSTIMVFACLLEVVVTSWLAQNEHIKTARRIDYVMRILFPAAFAGLILKTLV